MQTLEPKKNDIRFEDLFAFIQERWNIYAKKEMGYPKPWTEDKILQSYRFCNVHRENDTVTKWVAENIRSPHRGDDNLWFNLVIARLVNWPESLEALGYYKEWNPDHFISTLNERASKDEKVFSGAYIVSTNGVAMPKPQYLASKVLTPLWAQKASLKPHSADLLYTYYGRLSKFIGLGSFLTAQVIADLKYCPPLSAAPDWRTWSASGPGSRRGINRVFSRFTHNPCRDDVYQKLMALLHPTIDKWCQIGGIPPLHAQDLQNCLCEFDKYERVRLGEGRPRSTYPGV